MNGVYEFVKGVALLRKVDDRLVTWHITVA